MFDYSIKNTKAVMFFSAGSPKDVLLLEEAGISQILISYFYINKRKKQFEESIIPTLFTKPNSLFMVDSGGHTFIKQYVMGEATPEMMKEAYWLPYIEDYVAWLYKFKEYIFVAANIDLEMFVGNAIVDKWNKQYFKPLEKYMDVCYVAHASNKDKDGMLRVKQYCKEHSYVGVSGIPQMKELAKKIFAISQVTGTRIHGFGWTSIPVLKSSPFFSVDSTTWLGGARYGTTYLYDGKNFMVKDHKNKHVRKARKLVCEKEGINFNDVLEEKQDAINRLNLLGWLGARKEYLRAANTKLRTKSVYYYAKSKT